MDFCCPKAYNSQDGNDNVSEGDYLRIGLVLAPKYETVCSANAHVIGEKDLGPETSHKMV